MSRRPKLFVIALAAAAASASAFAHHSAAMFDAQKVVTLNGVVQEFRWTNPHASIDMLASEGTATPVLYSVELSTPNILVRKGWGAKSFVPGDKVTVVMHPMRDGGHAGLLINVTDAKGAVLKDHDY